MAVCRASFVGGVAVCLLVVNESDSPGRRRPSAGDRHRQRLPLAGRSHGHRGAGLAGGRRAHQADVEVFRRHSQGSRPPFRGLDCSDSDKPMCMTNRIAVNGDDPLAALITRVIEDLKQRTAAGLAGGATLEGEGWRLAAMQLSVARGRSVETLPFAEIDKVAVFDGKICLWRRGQDEPAARISSRFQECLGAGGADERVDRAPARGVRRPIRGNSRCIRHGPPAVRTTPERRFLAGYRPCRAWRRGGRGHCSSTATQCLWACSCWPPPWRRCCWAWSLGDSSSAATNWG